MKIIPVVFIKNKKMWVKQDEKIVLISQIFEEIKADEEIYIWDYDGIEENKPEFSIYQVLSEHYSIWVDAGPRILDDVVDIVIGGASNVVIRKNLFASNDLPDVKNFTDCLIYSYVDLQKEEKPVLYMPSYIDGLVICNNRKQFEKDFKLCELLKNLCKRLSVYVFDDERGNTKYWENIGVTGILLYQGKQVNVDG
ncbi:MAG: hypothetical protein QHH19_01675 [Candidatus Thermoplasmatota archaeon]|jgi:hypothetical protein|nr:hypothetical protein [Candidatus Thermoplasmatota archaeon]